MNVIIVIAFNCVIFIILGFLLDLNILGFWKVALKNLSLKEKGFLELNI